MGKIFLVIGFVILALLGTCTYLFSKMSVNFPDYAKREVVYAQYSDLIDAVDTSISNAESKQQLLDAFDKITYPKKTVRVVIEDDDNSIVIRNRLADGSSSKFIINGSGHGRLSKTDVILISYPINRFELDDVEIAIEYEPTQHSDSN